MFLISKKNYEEDMGYCLKELSFLRKDIEEHEEYHRGYKYRLEQRLARIEEALGLKKVPSAKKTTGRLAKNATVVCKNIKSLERAIAKKERDAQWLLTKRWYDKKSGKWKATFERI